MQEESRALEELGQVMGVMVYCCKILLFLTDSERKFTELTFVTSIDVRQITSVRH